MEQVYEKKSGCAGCTACENVCQAHAISMEPDEKGFLYPSIRQDLCVNCGKCVQTCPIRNAADEDAQEPLACVALRLHEDDALRRSSSGGVAFGLARIILERGGVVYGAAYLKDNAVAHIRVDSGSELEWLQGSKYVQSDVRGVFCRVRQDLEDGREVLFTGTGCQTAGLMRYLGKEYANLYTVDLICHGTPSPLFWAKYRKEELKRYGSCQVNMRDKQDGWATPVYTISRGGKQLKKERMARISFLRLFLNNYGLRDSCFDCAFKKMKHDSDITIGDCWGIEQIVKTRPDDGLGMSMAFINTAKGKKLLADCSALFWQEELNIHEAVQANLMLIRSVQHPKEENRFWETVREKSVKRTAYGFVPDDPILLKIKKALYPIKEKIVSSQRHS